jgi:formylglycine-generating enzyme required for sulfatase activity
MKKYAFPSAVVLSAISILSIHPSAQADTFGSGSNTFEISFVQISQTNNANDPASGNIYGAVPYEYRTSIYEITQAAITKATASGMANVTAGAWSNNQPAANVQWYEAAAFVNWLNTSSGKTAAYNLTLSGSTWSMTLQNPTNAWTLGGTNLYRNKDAYYFLPSDDEWYKAAYYNKAGTNYFLYPTASSSVPTSVASATGGGTNAGTAVFFAGGSGITNTAPAVVTAAGGLSPYGTMGQGGNIREWIETSFNGLNTSTTDNRPTLGGFWGDEAGVLSSTNRAGFAPSTENPNIGFRVASVPEPSTYALLLLGAGAMYLWKRRQGSL